MKKVTFAIGFALAGMLFFASCGGDQSSENTKESNTESTSSENTDADSDSDATISEDETADVSIYGTWRFKDMELGMKLEENEQANIDAMKAEMVKSNTMTFNEDGTYKTEAFVFGQIIKDSGTFTFDNNLLVSQSAKDDTTVTINIDKLTATEMIQSVTRNNQKVSIILGR